MNKNTRFRIQAAAAVVAAITNTAQAQSAWKLDTRSAAGPIAQVALADSGTKHRTSFIAFEYVRKCDPIFSFAEINGSRFGSTVSQAALNETKIGVFVNGKFHTWHAAMTKYDNGYEVGFGITNELFDVLVAKTDSLVFVTPNGERVPLPTNGFRQSVLSAFDTCVKRFK